MSAKRTLIPLLLVSFFVASLLLPDVQAWTLPAGQKAQSTVSASDLAWTAFGRPIGGPADVTGAAASAIACAVGDVTGDGVGDLLVQVQDAAGGALRLKALAGPDFQRIVWSQVTSLQRVLSCAPDLNLDGVSDPIIRTVGKATDGAASAAGAAQQSAQQVLQTVSGATGLPMLGRSHVDSHAGASAAAAFGVADDAASTLLPAAAGAATYVETQVKQLQVIPVPIPSLPLPVSTLTTTAQSTAHMLLMTAQGAVVATIDVGTPGVDPLALVPVPLGGGLPDVAALTKKVVSPVEEAAGSIPNLSLYNPDGTLAWAVDLAASTGVPVVVPRAGDLNLDGVPDIIVETLQQGVQTAPSAAFQVISGLDGQVLLDSGAPIDGLLAALPLGTLPGGAALLKVKHVAGAATMELSALDVTGAAKWTATINAAAMPINVALDAYTQDIVGFTDLTGDGLPDVGSAVRTGSSTALQVIDGVTGRVAWNATISNVQQMIPMTLAIAGPAVVSAQAGVTGALLVVSNGTSPALTLLDGASGKVQWTAQLVLSAAAPAVAITVQAAGDINADGVQDIVATVVRDASAGVGAAADVPASVLVIAGDSGQTLWLNATDAVHAGAVAALTVTPGPAYAAHSVPATASGPAKTSASPVAGVVAVLLVGLAAALRRRNPI